MLSQKQVRSQCASEGWGADLPTFRLRVVPCMVGVKKRMGGGRGEVKKGEELGKEGKGRRLSFFIFPFALFFSPPLPPIFAPITEAVTGYKVAAESLIPCPFPTGYLKDRSERGECHCEQLNSETSKEGKGTAGEAAILPTFISPPFFT